jgi:tungstate transport system permease protein
MDTIPQAITAALHLFTSLDSVFLAVIGRSVGISASASLLAFGLGVAAGAWLAVARFPGRGAVLAFLNTLLALPSVVVGLFVYLLLSRSGPLGFLGWLFSFQAMVLAQTILVAPIIAALTRQAIEDADHVHGEQLTSLGATPFMRGLLLAWDERYSLLTILLAGFGRAISEVGAVMIVGGNIEGFTRVMTTAIALETSKGDLPLAIALSIVLLLLVLALNALIAMLRNWRERIDGATTQVARAVVA